MYRPQESAHTGSFLVGVTQIALGVWVGGLLAAFSYESILAWRVQHAANQAAQALELRMAAEKPKSHAKKSHITCRADPSRGDCADSHIRARKAFEVTYQDT